VDIISFGFVSAGALIIVFSLIHYKRILGIIREQTYERGLFNSLLNHLAYFIMVLFIAGYIAVAIMLSMEEFGNGFQLVSLLLFLGAIYILCMVKAQEKATDSFVSKNEAAINTMIAFLEAKDVYIKGHSEHVCKLANLIYQYLPAHIKSTVDPVKLKDAAILHDIGKIMIPDGILDKTDALTEEEWEAIRQHPKNGKIILEKTIYREICDIVLCHHERLDGKGYYGIPASAIPTESKIIAMADTFSALYADRVFRKRYPFPTVISSMKESAGSQLDPELVDVFCSIPEAEIERLTVFSMFDGESVVK